MFDVKLPFFLAGAKPLYRKNIKIAQQVINIFGVILRFSDYKDKYIKVYHMTMLVCDLAYLLRISLYVKCVI